MGRRDVDRRRGKVTEEKTSKPRFCKDCISYKQEPPTQYPKAPHPRDRYICHHESLCEPVNGESIVECREARGNESMCGMSGRLWETC